MTAIMIFSKGYLALLALRLIFVFARRGGGPRAHLCCTACVCGTVRARRGYVHPDEFFQSQEVMAVSVLGCAWRPVLLLSGTCTRLTHRNVGYIPWEFAGDSPARSVVPPYASRRGHSPPTMLHSLT